MVSLKDIASDVGVSVPLVSKVLNNRLGSTGASKDTISKIRSAASRLGYRKNQAAAALRTGRQNVIGVFIHSLGENGSGLVEDIIRGVADGCRKQGLRQQLSFFETIEELEGLVCHATPVEMDGLIVAGLSHPGMEGILGNLVKSGLHVVTAFGTCNMGVDVPNCSSDEVMIATMAMDHLCDQGCKKIITIGPDIHPRRPAQIEALRRRGVPVDSMSFYECDSFAYEAGQQAIDKAIADGIDFDGVFAYSDQISLAVIQQLSAAGRSVPKDVKVIGVDNSPYCRFANVSVSSISGEDFRRAARAVEMLRELRNGKKVESETIAPKLYARRSTSL